MNLASWLLLGAVALWLIVAVVHIARHKGGCCGSGGCCGDCAHCAAAGCKGKRRRHEAKGSYARGAEPHTCDCCGRDASTHREGMRNADGQ